jgi:hypothetical protein
MALERWPATGVPPAPVGWIITTARNRAIDRLRREGSREARHRAAMEMVASDEESGEHDVQDDRLRLMFTCCHPAIATEAQLALTLRLLGGLTTAAEIARAFLVPEPTVAQRLSRAKAKIATRMSGPESSRPLSDPGCHQCRSLRQRRYGTHRLAPDPRAVRSAHGARAEPGRGFQPCGGAGRTRRRRDGVGRRRCPRTVELPRVPRGPRGSVATRRPPCGRRGGLSGRNRSLRKRQGEGISPGAVPLARAKLDERAARRIGFLANPRPRAARRRFRPCRFLLRLSMPQPRRLSARTCRTSSRCTCRYPCR